MREQGRERESRMKWTFRMKEGEARAWKRTCYCEGIEGNFSLKKGKIS